MLNSVLFSEILLIAVALGVDGEDVEELKNLVRDLEKENREMLRRLEAIPYLSAVQTDHEKRIRLLERVVMYGVGSVGGIKIIMDMLRH